MIIEAKTIIPHQRANTRDPSIENPALQGGEGSYRFHEKLQRVYGDPVRQK
jgi:hypothetical protein